MVRMKLSKEEFDPKALDIPQSESTFKKYRGEIPKNGTILIFRVTKMWWTQSRAGDSQIYLMAFAEQNEGSLAKYNGLPVKEYLTFNVDNAFRYMPFLNNFGLTTRDIYNKMDVEKEPDKIGDIINSIADWVVGSDDALCRLALIRDHYDPDETKAKVDVDGWLPYEDEDNIDNEDEDEDEDDDEPPARPAQSRTTQAPARGAKAASSRGRPTDDEDEDEEDEDIDDEEEDEEAEEEDQDEEDQEDEEPPATTSRRSRDTSRTSARTRPASTGRRAPDTSGRNDGERTRSGVRQSTARTARTPGPKGSKGQDGGFNEEPPF